MAEVSEVTAALGLLEEAGRFLLVANWRTLAAGRVLCWDVPGGRVESGEPLDAGCVREFKEETGLEVRVVDLGFMVERIGFHNRDPVERSRFYYFQVERTLAAKDAPLRPSDPEIVEAGFKTPMEIQALCPHGYQKELLRWLAGDRRPRYFHDTGGLAGLMP